MRPSARTAALASLALLLTTTACGEDPPPAPGFLDDWTVATPVDHDSTPTALDLLEPYGAAERFRADFRTNTIDGSWSFAGTRGQPKLRNGALRIRSTASAVAVWTVPIDAATTTHLAVRLAEIPPKSTSNFLRVYWQPEGTDEFPFDLAHSAAISYSEADGREALLPVARQPSWKGRIRAVALAFQVEETVRLESVRGIDLAPAVGAWLASEDAAPEQVAVEIQRMRHRALRTGPEHELRQTLRIPSETTRFTFQFAVHPLTAFLPASRTRFSVSVDDGTGERELSAFETPSAEFPRLVGWHTGDVALGTYAGREVELILRNRPATDAAVPTGLALWAQPRLKEHEPSATEAGSDRAPNVLLISIDTLRADHLESYGYDRPTSPSIARMADEGTRFANCTSHAPSTLPSHGALLTGIPAHANRVYGTDGNRLPSARETWAERLRAAGFATAAFAGGGYFDPHYGLDQGFDTYSYAKTGTQALDYSDLEFNVGRALEWLRNNADQRFFLFLHTYEVHGPFQPREAFLGTMVPEGVTPPSETSDLSTNARELPLAGPDYTGWRDFVSAPGEPDSFHPHAIERIVASYDSEIRHTDDAIGEVLATLEELGVADDTLVVLTSDHGEAFLEHGRTGHGHLYENNLHVPLVFRMPGTIPAGNVHEERVQLADVLPTCLEILNVPAPEDVRGSSLLGLMRDEGTLANRAIISYGHASGISYLTPGGKKLIVYLPAQHPQAGRWEFYDLNTDPDELHDASSELTPTERATLTARVHEALADLPGTHLVVRGLEGPSTFEGRVTLEGSHSSLLRQLRVFPLQGIGQGIGQGNGLVFESDDTVALSTGPWERLWLHVHAGPGRLRFVGELRSAQGARADVDWSVPLADLAAGPQTMTARASDGTDLAEGVALRVSIGQAADGSGGPSAETLQQLKDLGYL